MTGTAFGQHDAAWIRQHAPDDGAVHVADVTSAYACLGLWGPASRAILQPVTVADLSNDAFPYMTARELTVGPVPCLAVRVTYVGELGWELYCPTEFGARLWDELWTAGREHGLFAGGYKAIDSLRLEKGYRVWGADISPDDTPFEAGLDFAVKLVKGDFVGREALEQASEPRRRLRCLTLADPRAVALGSEPVRAGLGVGRVTSGGYGYTRRGDRVRLPPDRARRRHGGGGRSSASGSTSGRSRAALRPGGREDPRMNDVLAAAVRRAWPDGDSEWEVLGGGITNHNVKVVRPDGILCAACGRARHRPPRDRPHGRARGDAGSRRGGDRPRSSTSSSRRGGS